MRDLRNEVMTVAMGGDSNKEVQRDTTEYTITVTMDKAGRLLAAGLILRGTEPLLIYDKSFVGTRSTNGVVSSKKAVDFLRSPINLPQVGRLLLALDVLGLKGAADGLEESIDLVRDFLYARLNKKGPEGG